jgi:hypothetical protein
MLLTGGCTSTNHATTVTSTLSSPIVSQIIHRRITSLSASDRDPVECVRPEVNIDGDVGSPRSSVFLQVRLKFTCAVGVGRLGVVWLLKVRPNDEAVAVTLLHVQSSLSKSMDYDCTTGGRAGARGGAGSGTGYRYKTSCSWHNCLRSQYCQLAHDSVIVSASRRSSQPKLLIVALLIINHQLLFVPLRALTRLPQRTTEVTKFGPASASRVEAAYVELDHVRTAWAAGPARGAAELEDLCCPCIWTTDMRPISAVLLATLATCPPTAPQCRAGIHPTAENTAQDGS